MSQAQQPTPEQIKARQQKMQDVWDGVKLKAQPENDMQMAQALAFALVDVVEYVNDIEVTAADDRKFMEEVIYHTKNLERQNAALMQALSQSNPHEVRDVYKVSVDGGKYTVRRVQDDMVLGTFGKEMAEGLVSSLNSIPLDGRNDPNQGVEADAT